MYKPLVGDLVHIHAEYFDPDDLFVIESFEAHDRHWFVNLSAATRRSYRVTVAQSVIRPFVESAIVAWLCDYPYRPEIQVRVYKLGVIYQTDVIFLTDGVMAVHAYLIGIQKVTGLKLHRTAEQIMQRLVNTKNFALTHMSVN